ncbi:MAG: DUF4959 domain-containing protein, partial [Alistipes sp.]|nr:DUF4959 domain-containing protein [Alistipes sp.]
DVECESFIGSVCMKWKSPVDEDYYYTTISYRNAAGQTISKKVSRFGMAADGTTSTYVGGFSDTDEYEFTLVAHGYSGARSAPAVVRGTPLDISGAAEYVMESVAFEPTEAGARLSWVNETEIGVLLHLSYINGLGMYMDEEVDATATGSYTVSDLTGSTRIIVCAENVADGMTTAERSFEVTPIVDPRDVILVVHDLSKSSGIKSAVPVEGEPNAMRYVLDYNAAERFLLSVPLEQSLRRTDMMLVFQYRCSILARSQLMFMTNTAFRYDYDWNMPATDEWTTVTLDIQSAIEETKWGNAGGTFRILIWHEKELPISEYTLDLRNIYIRPK